MSNVVATTAELCPGCGLVHKPAPTEGQRRIVRRGAERSVAALLKEYELEDVHPMDGLLEVVRRTGGMARLLGALVEQLEAEPHSSGSAWEEDGAPVLQDQGGIWVWDHNLEQRPHVLMDLYGEWVDRYQKACKVALDANIDERLVRNATATADTLFTAFEEALDDVDLDPNLAHKLKVALASNLRRQTEVIDTVAIDG